MAHSPKHRKLELTLHNHIVPAITVTRAVWLYVLSADTQVGPKGVHMEKDNVFNSQAYAAGAPSVTISNDPSTASSSGSQTAYSGAAAAQAPTASAYQNSQNTQSTQSTNSGSNQAATSSSYSAGVHCLLLAPVSSHSNMKLPYSVAWSPTASTCQNKQSTQNTHSSTIRLQRLTATEQIHVIPCLPICVCVVPSPKTGT